MEPAKLSLLLLAALRSLSAKNATTLSPRALTRTMRLSRLVRRRRKVLALHQATMLLRLKKLSSNASIAVVEE